MLVVTSGEHGRRVVRAFVDTVVIEDLVATMNLVAPDASIHLGSPRNVAHDIGLLRRGLSYLARHYTIESNSITGLKSYSDGSDRAVVHMSCLTIAEQGYGYPTPSQWVIEVERQDDGQWLIDRLTCISVANGPPDAPGW